MKRTILSSVGNLAQLLKTNSELYSIPAFAGLKALIANYEKEVATCNCKGKASVTTKFQGQFNGALTVLSASDKAKMKLLLNSDQICYYKRNTVNNKLELTCF